MVRLDHAEVLGHCAHQAGIGAFRTGGSVEQDLVGVDYRQIDLSRRQVGRRDGQRRLGHQFDRVLIRGSGRLDQWIGSGQEAADDPHGLDCGSRTAAVKVGMMMAAATG